MPSIFYLDPVLGNDATTDTPLGWWSVPFTGGSGTAPVGDEVCTGATSGSTAKVTVIGTLSGGSWAGGDAAGTMYFYGKSAAFVAEQVDCAGGGHFHIAADFTYCPWKTITSGATAARIAPGDTIRIAKSPAPTSLGQNATWDGTPSPEDIAIESSTNATPIVVTDTGHALEIGDYIIIQNHATNTAANGMWKVIAKDANTFTLGDMSGNNSVGNGVGGATGTYRKVNNAIVTLTTAVTALVEDCQAAWSADNGASVSRQIANDYGRTSGACVKVTKASYLANTLYAHKSISSKNYKDYQQLTFWVYINSAVATSTTWRICLCDDANGASIQESFYIPAYSYTAGWVPITINKGSAIWDGNILSVALYTGATVPAANTSIYIDNINAAKAPSADDSITLHSLISKNALEKSTVGGTSYGNEGWYGIRGIFGTVISLDAGAQSKSYFVRGYYSSAGSESATLYKRETIKDAISSTNLCTIQDDGTAGNVISFLGGYNSADNTQDGETFFDGQAGPSSQVGLYCAKSYVTISNLSFVRFYYGISVMYPAAYVTLDFISNSNNNAGYGVYVTANGVTINTLISVCANGNSASSIGIMLGGYLIKVGTVVYCCGNYYGISQIGYGENCFITKIKYLCSNYLGVQGGLRTWIYEIENCSYNYIGANCYNESVIGTITTEGNVYSLRAVSYWSINRASISESIILFPSTICFQDEKVRVDRVDGHSYVGTQYANAVSQDAVRHTASGEAWQMNVTNSARTEDYPFRIPIARIAVAAGTLVTFKAWMKLSSTTDILGALVCRAGQLSGLTEQKTDCSTADTDWHEVTITFTPAEAGVVEIEAWAWWVANAADESVYIDDVTVTQA